MAVTGVMNSNNIKTNETMKAAGNVQGSGRLSETAQAYVNELRQKYPEMNLTIASFANERQSDAYMFGSSGANNVAIASNIIEKMAADPSTAAKYEKLLAEVPENAKKMIKFCEDNNSVLYGSGMIIDKDGKVTYWAIGGDKEPRTNPVNVYKEKVQKALAEKREVKKQEEALKEKQLKKAESRNKLLEKIATKKETDDITSLKYKEKGLGEVIDFSV